MKQKLGQTIRKYRKEKDYTINEFAEKLNISTGLLSNIETGKTDAFQLNLLNNIINELDMPISELNLFSKPYSIENLKLDTLKDFKKITPNLEILTSAFIEASSTLSFDEHKISLLTELLVNELNTIPKILKAAESK